MASISSEESQEKEKVMKYLRVALMVALLAFSGSTVFAHGDKKPKPPEKVSSAMMSAGTIDTVHRQGMLRMHEETEDTVGQGTTQRDFETIRAEVQGSSAFIVIKALALAAAIAGLAILYLPRKNRGHQR
jgi:hypothetical protein